MASRRVRIKGIANIPERRKAATAVNENRSVTQEENKDNKCEDISNNSIKVEPELCVNTVEGSNQANTETSIADSNVEISSAGLIDNQDNAVGVSTYTDINIEESRKTPIPHYKDNEIIKETSNKENHVCIENNVDTGKDKEDQNEKQVNRVPFVRRKFLKPPVRVNTLNRVAREGSQECKTEPSINENANINLNEIEISTDNKNTSLVIQKTEQPVVPLTVELGTIKEPCKDSGRSGSDTEYQQAPASPTKILNRRIRAIPKLHQRRTSFSVGSASESEDDTRKSYNSTRNDSVCSANSATNEMNLSNEAKSPTRKDCGTVVQRKCRKTEQTRKLAAARREFNMKFNNGKPDKQKLTMIDLIFYNPSTSPMSHNKRKRKSTISNETNDANPREEEKVDDPQPANESDNEMPAPQIKVGPNGEIIVDEKSLIIENAETKRGREALQLSEVVNGDDDTTYGVYKKVKRTKEWSNDETLRFYKALNTIGTDFTLMCELFPNRTRRDLKMKFKKEEKLNQTLINKAVMQPSEFDMTELRKDLELETRRAEEYKKRAEETKVLKEAAAEHRKKIKGGVKVKGIDGSFEELPPTVAEKREPDRKKRKKTTYEVIKGGINSVLSESDDDCEFQDSTSTVNQQSDKSDNEDEESVSSILKPTRYGRIPKARLPDMSDVHTKQVRKKKMDVETSSSDKAEDDLEPGSIMIVKSKSSTDVVYNVYIVTENQTKQQIDLSPNVLQNLTNGDKLCGIQTQNILTISQQEINSDMHYIMDSLGENNIKERLSNGTRHTNLEIKELPITKGDNSLSAGKIEIQGDRIIFPFDESLTSSAGNQNITVSHEDNKMIVVTES